MTLSAAADAVGYVKPRQGCLFGDILSNLDAEDLAFYEQMVADGAARETIALAFTAYGHPVGETAVRRHQNGRCACR
jgi:hypothetical protein